LNHTCHYHHGFASDPVHPNANEQTEHWKGYETKGVKYSKLKTRDLQSENGDRRECQSRNLTCKLGDCVTYPKLEEVSVMPKIAFEPQQPTSLFWQHRLTHIVHIKIRHMLHFFPCGITDKRKTAL
jgi:hypothetical protein